MLRSIAVDTHTHTVLSGHAWSTLRENSASAAKKGLAGICLTEHGHAMPGSGPFFLAPAQKMLPRSIEGVRLFRGIEANIIDLHGRLDISDRFLLEAEFCIASLHDLCMTPGTPAENTAAMITALGHPGIDVLGHIDDIRAPCDFERIILAAKELGRLVEINNNSVIMRKNSLERVTELARLCAKHGARVTVSSDAHFDDMIGTVGPALEILDNVGLPDELVVNRSLETFNAYLAERDKRVRNAVLGITWK